MPLTVWARRAPHFRHGARPEDWVCSRSFRFCRGPLCGGGGSMAGGIQTSQAPNSAPEDPGGSSLVAVCCETRAATGSGRQMDLGRLHSCTGVRPAPRALGGSGMQNETLTPSLRDATGGMRIGMVRAHHQEGLPIHVTARNKCQDYGYYSLYTVERKQSRIIMRYSCLRES